MTKEAHKHHTFVSVHPCYSSVVTSKKPTINKETALRRCKKCHDFHKKEDLSKDKSKSGGRSRGNRCRCPCCNKTVYCKCLHCGKVYLDSGGKRIKEECKVADNWAQSEEDWVDNEVQIAPISVDITKNRVVQLSDSEHEQLKRCIITGGDGLYSEEYTIYSSASEDSNSSFSQNSDGEEFDIDAVWWDTFGCALSVDNNYFL